jgi:hypothetical protein
VPEALSFDKNSQFWPETGVFDPLSGLSLLQPSLGFFLVFPDVPTHHVCTQAIFPSFLFAIPGEQTEEAALRVFFSSACRQRQKAWDRCTGGDVGATWLVV